jgi:hypothetical protein
MNRDTVEDPREGTQDLSQDALDSSPATGSRGLSESHHGTRVKVCCVCGKDVSHEKRYKDARGKYWCEECNEDDHQRKHPVDCADCHKPFRRKQLEEIENVLACHECAEKRRVAARRAAARIKAAEEELKQDQERHRHWIEAAVVVIVVAVVALVLYKVVL